MKQQVTTHVFYLILSSIYAGIRLVRNLHNTSLVLMGYGETVETAVDALRFRSGL